MIERRSILKNVVGGGVATAALYRPHKATALDDPIAETRAGRVRGTVDNGVYVFKGVPYGADTATTRYQPPKAPASWPGVRDALADGPIAPQTNSRASYDEMSEDCLTLNLWTPGLKDGKKRPVMLWLHGGGTTQGSYRGVYGRNLADNGDVVVIAINHRLGALGFLYLAEFAGDLPDSGNVGMLDIVHALKWVNENIESFGGDPSNVTVFGCSGGGAKLSMLLGMPAAKGLFHKAIIESGGADLRTKTSAEGRNAAVQYLENLGIPQTRVHDLFGMTTIQLLEGLKRPDSEENMGAGRFFSPVVDGRSLPHDSFIPEASPVSADVPLIVGYGRWEYTNLLGTADPALFELSWEDLPRRLSEVWQGFRLPHDSVSVVREYRRMFPSYTPSEVFFRAVTASKFGVGAITQASRKAAQEAAPVYHYVVEWNTPVQGGRLRAPHGIEVPLVFNSVKETPGQTGGGPDAQHMADQMSSAWIAFAHTGKPESQAVPSWPAYDLQTRQTMIFNTESKVLRDPYPEARAMWQDLQKSVHA